MINTFMTNLLWTEGFSICLLIGLMSIVGYIFWKPLLYLSCFIFVFSFYFFRNPERICLVARDNPDSVICPADGKVVSIEQGSFDYGFTQKVAIFLSPFDVHVQWTPMHGVITDIIYRKGTFAFAFLPKSSDLNERNDVMISSGIRRMCVRQIAGTIARRICCWVVPGQEVSTGFKYGMIRFGSRIEVLVGSDIEFNVEVGQRVYGGQTALGFWK